MYIYIYLFLLLLFIFYFFLGGGGVRVERLGAISSTSGSVYQALVVLTLLRRDSFQ